MDLTRRIPGWLTILAFAWMTGLYCIAAFMGSTWAIVGLIVTAFVAVGVITRAFIIKRRIARVPRAGLCFEYDSGWRTCEVTCRLCGWKGPLEQGEAEHFSDLMEIWCPKCIPSEGSKLALVTYPLVRGEPTRTQG